MGPPSFALNFEYGAYELHAKFATSDALFIRETVPEFLSGECQRPLPRCKKHEIAHRHLLFVGMRICWYRTRNKRTRDGCPARCVVRAERPRRCVVWKHRGVDCSQRDLTSMQAE